MRIADYLTMALSTCGFRSRCEDGRIDRFSRYRSSRGLTEWLGALVATALLLAPLTASATDTPPECVPFDKEVSIDGGLNWFDADSEASAPVQVVGAGAEYRFVINNCFVDKNLENNLITDPYLFIYDAPVGGGVIVPGQTVIVTKDDPGFENLDQPGRCDTPGIKFNKGILATTLVAQNPGTEETTYADEAYLKCIEPEKAALGDRVWEDLDVDGVQDCEDSNGNGILGDVDPLDPANPAASDQGPECGDRDSGGAGIAGVPVNLFQPDINGDCTIDLGTQVLTGPDGLYLFADLAPGEYCVQFDISALPDDFCTTDGFELGAPQFTDLNVGGDPAVDSDAESDGLTDGLTLVAGETNRTLDAGIFCPAKIGDRVWEDTDQDGLQDDGESGVEGVTVTLFECGPDGIAGTADDVNTGESRVTDAMDGMYMFGAEPGVFDLPPGDYYVQFDPTTFPAGSDFTTPNAPGGDDSNDSDCLPPDGITSCVTLGSRGINLNRDCGITPECDLTLDKQCRVETPPVVSEDAKCDGKLKEFTVVWNGAGPIDIAVGEGLTGSSQSSAIPGDEVTFFTDGSTNDTIVNISGAGISGQSTFHVSCSDGDMDGATSTNDDQLQVAPLFARDCGKDQGDGKGDSGFINQWLLEGFVDNSDQVLDCTVEDSGDGFTQDCSFTLQPAASCDNGPKPETLTWRYDGGTGGDGDCADSTFYTIVNEDGKLHNDFECTGSVDPALQITAMDKDGNSFLVGPGETFTTRLDDSDEISLTDSAGNTQDLVFHTSCSQPLEAGATAGALTLEALDNRTNGVDVSYQYTVINNGAPLTGVTVDDTELGQVGGPMNLGTGEEWIFTAGPVSITETTTNVATASAEGSLCTASDSVTVTAVEPTCDVQIVFDDLSNDAVKYKVTNTSNIVATLDTFVFNFPAAYGAIKEIKLDGAIYKADDSTLVVGPGVMIGAGDWTEPDVSKRELDPGETRTLEVKFTTQHEGGNWVDLADAGGLVTFEEGCEVILRAPNACEIDKPTELVFEYTGDACSATTNFQDGGFECEPVAGGAIGGLVEVLMTKDEDKFTVESLGTEVRIFRSDDPGKEFPSEIKYDVIGTAGTQSHVLHTSCSKPLNLDDQFGALILREFIPKTN